MAHHQPFQVIGFHSCDKDVGLKMLRGEDQLAHSINPYDWLGSGVYFWEQNPEKALSYAVKCAIGKQKYNGNIKIPFVVGAIIELGQCLNLVEPQSLNIVEQSFIELQATFKKTDALMPENNKANRGLDCAVIQNIHASNKKLEVKGYDTVRSPFHEDEPVYPTSNFTRGLHIEVCVISTDLIRGYFLPRPIDLYNPFLHGKFDKEKELEKYLSSQKKPLK